VVRGGGRRWHLVRGGGGSLAVEEGRAVQGWGYPHGGRLLAFPEHGRGGRVCGQRVEAHGQGVKAVVRVVRVPGGRGERVRRQRLACGGGEAARQRVLPRHVHVPVAFHQGGRHFLVLPQPFLLDLDVAVLGGRAQWRAVAAQHLRLPVGGRGRRVSVVVTRVVAVVVLQLLLVLVLLVLMLLLLLLLLLLPFQHQLLLALAFPAFQFAFPLTFPPLPLLLLLLAGQLGGRQLRAALLLSSFSLHLSAFAFPLLTLPLLQLAPLQLGLAK
jgi:hypothetical protein